MTVLNIAEAEIAKFIEAADDVGYGITENNVAATDTTIADLTEKWGAPDEEDLAENGLKMFFWRSIQTRKGARRGELIATPVEGGSLSYFGGQV